MADLTTVAPDVDEATGGDPDGPSPGDRPDGAPNLPAPPARGRPSRWAMLMAGLAALLIVLTAADVALLVSGDDAVGAQREPALATARQVALDLSSIGAGNAEAQLAKLRVSITGQLREQLSGDAEILPPLRTPGQVVSVATVHAAGLERIDVESAVALVAVSATVVSTQLPDGELRRYRLVVELRREGDRWLASSVTYVP